MVDVSSSGIRIISVYHTAVTLSLFHTSLHLIVLSSIPFLYLRPPCPLHTAGGGGSLQYNENITTPFNHHRRMEDPYNWREECYAAGRLGEAEFGQDWPHRSRHNLHVWLMLASLNCSSRSITRCCRAFALIFHIYVFTNAAVLLQWYDVNVFTEKLTEAHLRNLAIQQADWLFQHPDKKFLFTSCLFLPHAVLKCRMAAVIGHEKKHRKVIFLDLDTKSHRMQESVDTLTQS